MTNPIDDPDELHALASTAVGHAIESLQPRGPFLPFALIEDESGVRLFRAIGDRLEDMLAEARRHVAGITPKRAVVAWDGFTSYTGEKLDAVLVEAYEAGAAGGIVIAQPYRRVGVVKKRIQALGTGAVIQRGSAPLFA